MVAINVSSANNLQAPSISVMSKLGSVDLRHFRMLLVTGIYTAMMYYCVNAPYRSKIIICMEKLTNMCYFPRPCHSANKACSPYLDSDADDIVGLAKAIENSDVEVM
jgi:hypothetical protein